MGAIKDIVDLTRDLESRARDRRDMDTIHKIQMLAFSLQSQHADIVERDVALVQENAELKRQLAESQAEEIRLHSGIEFRRGKRTGGEWMPFCPKCHMPAFANPNANRFIACTAHCGWLSYVEPQALPIILSRL
jgi:hypothetical protein